MWHTIGFHLKLLRPVRDFISRENFCEDDPIFELKFNSYIFTGFSSSDERRKFYAFTFFWFFLFAFTKAELEPFNVIMRFSIGNLSESHHTFFRKIIESIIIKLQNQDDVLGNHFRYFLSGHCHIWSVCPRFVRVSKWV